MRAALPYPNAKAMCAFCDADLAGFDAVFHLHRNHYTEIRRSEKWALTLERAYQVEMNDRARAGR
jgi:hypothetical protein